jgi:hypothetical protein
VTLHDLAQSLLGVPSIVARGRVIALYERNLDQRPTAGAEDPVTLGQCVVLIDNVLEDGLEDDSIAGAVGEWQLLGDCDYVDSRHWLDV